ncbi:LacI family DNA-binding transcriptional regulator [Achromobacter spanius]|nr:LacI family DNA-binding transcriptional regulator [Achromobacter spanius]
MPVKNKVTILDVAKLAGVSQGSVSRVVTGKNWVSEDLRERVEAAVKQLGFRPNANAQGLKSQRSRAVAALVSDISNPLHGRFLASAEGVLSQAGYLLFVSSTHNLLDRELDLLKGYSAGRVDGLIVAHSDEGNKSLSRALKASNLPIVFHDRDPHGIGDTVICDHAKGAFDATTYLASLGHRRIAVMTPPAAIRPGRERLLGYKEALSAAKVRLDERLVATVDASDERAYEVARTLLASVRTRPSAIICLGTRMLAGVLEACADAGLSIPRDISLIGIGDTDLVRLHHPPITTVRWDIEDCGRQAADLMLDRLDPARGAAGSKIQVRHAAVELVTRGSCAPPRS